AKGGSAGLGEQIKALLGRQPSGPGSNGGKQPWVLGRVVGVLDGSGGHDVLWGLDVSFQL
ncbi:MAG: hypothetical protein ACK5TP_07830, partial [bacterium]